jgi:tight adherence protein B
MALLVGLLVGTAVWMGAGVLLPRLALPGVPRLRGERPAGGGERASLLDRFRAARNLAKLRAQLPAGLSALSTSVRAGLSLPQAVQSAGESLGGPLGGEFRRMTAEMSMGGTLETSLLSLEGRAPIPEIRLLSAGLRLARSTGGSLGPLLDQLGETMREREKLRGQLKAMTAQGRLSGYVMGATPFVLVAAMAVLDPEFLHPLVSTPEGWMVLAAAAVLEVIGTIAIRSVVRMEA